MLLKNAILATLLLLASLFLPLMQYKKERVSKNALIDLKVADHPRIIINSSSIFDSIAVLAKSDPYVETTNNNILREATVLLKKSPISYPRNIKRSVGYQNRQIYSRIFALIYAYKVTNDQRFFNRLWRELEVSSSFTDWGNKHFLDVAEMLYAYSVAYDWLYDKWTPEQRTVLKNAIVEKGLNQGRKFYEGNVPKGWFNWRNVSHNWNQICNGSLIIAAVAVAEEEPELSNLIITNSVSNLKRAMGGYAPDGGWMEGTHYLSYALRYNVGAIAALQSATGNDQGLSSIAGFSETGKFIVSMAGPTGLTFNFADAAQEVVTSSELFWLSGKFHQKDLFDYQLKYSSRHIPLELIWYIRAKNASKNNNLNLINSFKDVWAASYRSSKSDSSALFLAFKGGKNGVNHGHLDEGTFVLDNLSKRWVVDIGKDDYQQEGYFSVGNSGSSSRWQYYNVSTQGHNTLLIDNKQSSVSNLNQNLKAVSKIVSISSDPSDFSAILDLTDAYKSKNLPLSSVRRGFRVLKGTEVVIQDEITSASPVNVIWQIHTNSQVQLTDNGKAAVMNNDGQVLEARIISPSGSRFEMSNIGAINRAKLISPLKLSSGLTKLYISAEKISKGTITVLFKRKGDNNIYRQQVLSSW